MADPLRLVWSSTGPDQSIQSDYQIPARISSSDVAENAIKNAPSISSGDLYPAGDEVGGPLTSALRLSKEALACITEAREAVAIDELFIADDALLKFKALLPEMFCCREIGDGFGLLTGSLLNVFNYGQATDPFLLKEKLETLHFVVWKIFDSPIMKFEVACELVERLESVGMETKPPGIDDIAEALIEQ